MPRSILKDILHGAFGFAAVGIAAFSVWAFGSGWFRNLGGELGMYSAIAIVFIGLSGLILGPLAGGMGRFYKAFLPAFIVYSVLWCAAWFGLKDKSGEWLGAFIGCVAFTLIAVKMLGNSRGWLVSALGLFVLHTAGYFAGDWSMHGVLVPKARALGKGHPEFQNYITLAKLSWGFFYGLGFGAGLGWLFHRARKVA